LATASDTHFCREGSHAEVNGFLGIADHKRRNDYPRSWEGAINSRDVGRISSPLADRGFASGPEYFGKWVVLEGNQVVASGSNPKQLYEDVRANGFSSPFPIFVSPDDHEPFAGGWTD